MTDVRQGTGTCPDFESLSCYADGELDATTAAHIAVHVADCSRCGLLAVRLREGFEADDARRDGGIGGSGCATEEHLVIYATGGLSGAERAAVAAHVASCDACIAALALLHRRLRVSAVVDTPIPAGIQHRALLALETGVRSLAPGIERSQPVVLRSAVLLHRVRRLIRMPVLVPMAMAAGALLMVAWQPGWMDSSGSAERSRAVAPDTAKRRVTVTEAAVRSRPSMQSEIVATVRHGALVEIAGEERGWYEVRVDGGRPGWVEREAFE